MDIFILIIIGIIFILLIWFFCKIGEMIGNEWAIALFIVIWFIIFGLVTHHSTNKRLIREKREDIIRRYVKQDKRKYGECNNYSSFCYTKDEAWNEIEYYIISDIIYAKYKWESTSVNYVKRTYEDNSNDDNSWREEGPDNLIIH